MEKFIEAYCKYGNYSFDKTIQYYNSNTKSGYGAVDCMIDYKIENNKDIIYKEDILKICSKLYKKDISQEEFIEKVIERIKHYNLDINNLIIGNSFCSYYLWLYYISTFLEHEPVDIKIALKD